MPTIFRQPVWLGMVSFNNSGTAPAGAQSWGIDIMEGWKSTPEPTVFSTELGSGRDGSASADFFPLASRVLVVGGYVLAPDQETAEELHDLLLKEALPRNTVFRVTRNESIPKYVEVKRSGAVETDWSMENGFRWQTTLLADDPFKYADEEESASAGVAGQSTTGLTFPVTFPVTFTGTAGSGDNSAGIYNRGNAPSSHVTVEIVGPLSRGGWRLRNDTVDGELSYDVGLTSTDFLLIDFRTQNAYLNGYLINSALVGDFWQVAPGNNAIRLYADYDPDTSFTIFVESAWE